MWQQLKKNIFFEKQKELSNLWLNLSVLHVGVTIQLAVFCNFKSNNIFINILVLVIKY